MQIDLKKFIVPAFILLVGGGFFLRMRPSRHGLGSQTLKTQFRGPQIDRTSLPRSTLPIQAVLEYRIQSFERLPAEDAKEYATVYKAWAVILEKAQFPQSLMPYAKGNLRQFRYPDGRLDKRVATWYLHDPSCRTEVSFSPDWAVIGERAACGQIWVTVR